MPGKASTPRLVFVSSPYRGEVPRNLAVARAAARLVFDAGHVPIVPHLYIPLVLDDDVPEERDQGISAALRLLAVSDELWAFGDPTEGMAMEIAEAGRLEIPVHRRRLPPPAGPCWRCGGGQVIRIGGDLDGYSACPECARPSARRSRG